MDFRAGAESGVCSKTDGTGRIDYRLENMGEDEIGQIGLAFNQLSDQIQELIRENYEKKIRIQTSELNLLQEQINPHFLYNALAVISALAMREGGKQTMQAVKNLSSFYRISLNKGKRRCFPSRKKWNCCRAI